MALRAARSSFAVSLPLLALGVVGLAPDRASASGLDVPQIGTTFSSPVTKDAAALYWNPGMLGFVQGGEAMLSVGIVAGSVSYERHRLGAYQLEDSLQFQDPIDPAYIDPTKPGISPAVRSPIFSPNAGAFIAAPLIRDRLTLGVGVYVPYAAPLSFPEDGPQRFALQEVFIAASRVSAGLGAKVHERVSLGASVSYVLGFGQLKRVQDFAAVDVFAEGLANPPISQDNSFGVDAPSTVRELSVLARPIALTNAISHGVAFNVGLAANPIDPLWLGLSYDHGSRLNLRGNFQLDMNDPFFTEDLAAQGLAFPPLVTGDANLRFRLPKRIMLGIGYDINDKLRVDGNFAYVFWSDVESFEITLDSADLEQPELGIPRQTTVALPRDWRGVVHAELNVRARVGKRDRVGLSGTIGYHSSSSPDSTIDVASPDGNRLIGALGGRFDVNEKVSLVLDGEVQAILPRTVETSDFDLGNGVYNLVIGGVTGSLLVRFGKGGKVLGGAVSTGEEGGSEGEEAAASEDEMEAQSEDEMGVDGEVEASAEGDADSTDAAEDGGL